MAPVLPYLGLGTASLAFGILLALLSAWADRRGSESGHAGRSIFHVGGFTGAAPAQLLFGFWGVALYGLIFGLLTGLARIQAVPPALLLGSGPRGAEGRRGRGGIGSLLAVAAGGLSGVLLVGPFAVVGYLVCGWGVGLGEWVKETRPGGRGRPSSPSVGKVQARSWEGSMAIMGGGSAGGWAALALLGYPFLQSVAVGALAGLVGTFGEALSPEGAKGFWLQLLPSLSAWWLLG